MRVRVQRSNWIEQQHCRNAQRAWSGAANVQIKASFSDMCCKPHGATNLQCYRRIVFSILACSGGSMFLNESAKCNENTQVGFGPWQNTATERAIVYCLTTSAS